jgi:hypothetical protein
VREVKTFFNEFKCFEKIKNLLGEESSEKPHAEIHPSAKFPHLIG